MGTGRLLTILVAVLIGIAVGLGGFTFVYAKGSSYLGTDPAACANCHIMDEHYSAWLKSSHRAVATCNDCHTPHSTIPKYVVKARNGFWHSFYFTTGNFPDPLRITPANHTVTENACRYCHEAIAMSIHATEGEPPDEVRNLTSEKGVECTRCHRYVGHMVR